MTLKRRAWLLLLGSAGLWEVLAGVLMIAWALLLPGGVMLALAAATMTSALRVSAGMGPEAEG